MIICYICKYC